VGNKRLNANGSHYYLIYSKLFHKGIVNIFKWMPKYWSFNSCSLELNSKLFFVFLYTKSGTAHIHSQCSSGVLCYSCCRNPVVPWNPYSELETLFSGMV